MLGKFDYHNFDRLEITAKTAKEKDLVSHYALFGWQETARKEDKRFFDIAHITFIRPHKIKNKDRLQLLQIYYESYMNQLYRCEKTAYTGSVAFLTSALLTALILASIGIIFIFSVPLALRIFGGVLCLLSAIFIGGSCYKTALMRKKEKGKFNKKYDTLKKNIDEVLCVAKMLLTEDV